MQVAHRVFGDANVPPEKEMSALGADAHFIKGPPFLEWISLPEKVQFTAIGLKESHAFKYTNMARICEAGNVVNRSVRDRY